MLATVYWLLLSIHHSSFRIQHLHFDGSHERANQVDDADDCGDEGDDEQKAAPVESETEFPCSLLVAGRELVLREVGRRDVGRHVSSIVSSLARAIVARR